MTSKIMSYQLKALSRAIGRPVNQEKEEVLEAMFSGFLAYHLCEESKIPESVLNQFLKSINKDEFFIPGANALRKRIAFSRDDTLVFDEWCRMYAYYYCNDAKWAYNWSAVTFTSRQTGEVVDEITRH